METIVCPRCGVTYQTNPQGITKCMDCGNVYHQKTQSLNVLNWIREAIVRTVG